MRLGLLEAPVTVAAQLGPKKMQTPLLNGAGSE